MRKLLIAASAVTLLGAIAAWPFASAFTIARAIQDGDTSTLQQRVDWPRVKETLRQSIAEDARSGILVGEGQAPPGKWERVKVAVKATATPRIADQVIERYVTPEGLPQLFSYGQAYRKHVDQRLGHADLKGPLAGTWFGGGRIDRGLALIGRLERISLVGPSRIEVTVKNSQDPTRRYFTAFERNGLQWNLAEVRVLPRRAGVPAVVAPNADNEP